MSTENGIYFSQPNCKTPTNKSKKISNTPQDMEQDIINIMKTNSNRKIPTSPKNIISPATTNFNASQKSSNKNIQSTTGQTSKKTTTKPGNSTLTRGSEMEQESLLKRIDYKNKELDHLRKELIVKKTRLAEIWMEKNKMSMSTTKKETASPSKTLNILSRNKDISPVISSGRKKNSMEIPSKTPTIVPRKRDDASPVKDSVNKPSGKKPIQDDNNKGNSITKKPEQQPVMDQMRQGDTPL